MSRRRHPDRARLGKLTLGLSAGSTHAPNWKQAWKLIEAVDRDNIGYNPDSFQIAGAEWADPTAQDGLVEAASDSERNKRFEASLEELATTIPGDKIYFYQISDAYRVQPPLEKKTIDGLRPRGRWSGAYRPVPYSDGYLPVEQVTRAVLRTGFRGIFSLEVFDGGKEGKGKEVDFGEFAQDAMLSVQKLLDAVAEDGPCGAEST